MNEAFENINKAFINHLKESGKSESTCIAYKKDIAQILEGLEEEKVSDLSQVTPENLQNILSKISQKFSYTPKTVSRKINSIRTFFKYLIDTKKITIDDNPALKLQHPKIENKPPRILTKTEYMALKEASRVDTRLYAMIEVLLQTGIRIGELQRLKLGDIRNTNNGHYYLYIEAYGSHPARHVPLNQSAYVALQEYIKIRPKAKPGIENIFITKNGNMIPSRNLRGTLMRAFKIANIKNATVNDIRNTFIAHHLAKGKDLLTIAKIVGHKRISTTEKYLGLLDKKDKKENLEEL